MTQEKKAPGTEANCQPTTMSLCEEIKTAPYQRIEF